MKTNSPLLSSSISELQAQTLTQLFCAVPAEATFSGVLENLAAWLSSGLLILRTRYAGLTPQAVEGVMRHALYAHLAVRLPDLLDLAQSHVDDIEEGVQDGTYSASENADLPEKTNLVDAFRLCVPASPQATHTGPTLVLVILSSGGIVSTYSEVGMLPGVLIEVIDCMNGDAGDQFILDACWSDLVDAAFDKDVPHYVHLDHGGQAIDTLEKPLLRQLINEGHLPALQALVNEAPCGVSRLNGTRFFQYEVDGEQCIFTDRLRSEVEAALGAPLTEVVYEGYDLETALATPPEKLHFLRAFLAEHSSTATDPTT